MSCRIYSKPGCVFCVKAKDLMREHAMEFTEIVCADLADLRAQIGPLAPPNIRSFPLVVESSGNIVGGYEDLRDLLEEPLLRRNLERFSIFPIEYPDVFELYKQALASFWTADEIDLRQDVADFKALSSDEQHFIKHILAFFASSDGIVNENLLANFSTEIQCAEARQFFAFQAFNEAEHNRTYGTLIDTLITEPRERERLFNAIVQVPAVKKKAEWALQWLDRSRNRFATRLVAFMCVEGILFSGSFAAIFWLKKYHEGLMPGLSLSNQFISRDEGLHCKHAATLYRKLVNKLTQAEVVAIVKQAVDNEKQFITEAVPCTLVGMNAALMSQYIEFVADQLLVELGHARTFKAANPFAWMESIALEGKTNFFEARVSEYARAGVMGTHNREFSLSVDF